MAVRPSSTFPKDVRAKIKASKYCPRCGGWLFRATFGGLAPAWKCFQCGCRIDKDGVHSS